MTILVKCLFALLGPGVRKKHFKEACEKADRLRMQTFKKQLVVMHRGEFIVVSKQRLKAMYQNGDFKKGHNFRDIENAALYSTP